MKAVAWQIEVRRVLRSIHVTEHVRDPAALIGSDLARVPFEEAFQTAVPEGPDHQDTVPCIGTDIKRKTARAASGFDVEFGVVGGV
jgi:hypothetical protein